MFIDASANKAGQKARLLSVQHPVTNSKCLEFWYHMHAGTLNIYKKTGSAVGTRVWTESGDQGDEWLVARVGVWSPARPFWLSFEGVVGSAAGAKGYIAIDDVKFLNGNCPPPGECSWI